MESSSNENRLFREFPPVPTEAWEEAILKDLKGADYQKKLVWKSLDGIAVKPYYRAEDLNAINYQPGDPGSFPYVRGNAAGKRNWLIRQEINVTADLAAAIKKVHHLLEKGVESISLVASEALNESVLIELIDLLPFEAAEFTFEGFHPASLIDALSGVVNKGKYTAGDLRCLINFDPIGDFILSGSFETEEDAYELMKDCFEKARPLTEVRFISVNGRYFKASGSTIVQELAFSIAVANDYLAELTQLGVEAAEVVRRIGFVLSVGPDYFFEMAKFRAARLLWTRVLEAYGLEPGSKVMRLDAETSTWNKTVYDAHVNLLRTTTEAMSAVLGGADALQVWPFDKSWQDQNEFSERLARNQQILLREESYLNQVADPAGGSYYIESLTHEIAQAAWQLFQQVEEIGGFTEAFYQGWVQNEVVTMAQQRDQAVANRREMLLGINQYPDTSNGVAPQAMPAHIKSKIPDPEKLEVQPLIRYRGAESFELLRMATETSGKRPKVFLLTIGNVAMRRARAGFVTNFFGCAGYQIIDNHGFDNIAQGVDAALAVDADLVVLCSSDEEYADMAPEAARLLSGKAILVVAGNPVGIADQLKEAGVTNFVHVKSPVLETLKAYNRMLGLPVSV